MPDASRELPPDALPESGTLYFNPSAQSVEDALRHTLTAAQIGFYRPHARVVAVRLTSVGLTELATALSGSMAESELQSIRCCVVRDGLPPSPAEFMMTQSLTSLLAQVRGQWLLELMSSGRLVTHYQPIVHCGGHSEVFAYECLVRGAQPDGKLIFPDRLFEAARALGVLSHLDRLACTTAIQSAMRIRLTTNVFINFNPASTFDPLTCLRDATLAAPGEAIAPDRIVLEVVESDEVPNPDRLLDALNDYRDVGFRVALDDLGAGYSSLNLMTKLKPDFVKLDMELVRNVDRDRYKSRVASKLLELARDLGVQTVVEGLETLGEWQWAQDHQADFAQGYWFARPAADPPRPQVQPAITPHVGGDASSSQSLHLAPIS